jgi:hypothetical protein
MINASLQRGCLAKGFCAAVGCCEKADEPATQQSVTRISEELGIHGVTLKNWRKS